MSKVTENRALFEANHFRHQYLASESKYWRTLKEKKQALTQLEGTAKHLAVKTDGLQRAIAELVAIIESDPDRARAIARDVVDRHVAVTAAAYPGSENEKAVLAVLERGSTFAGLGPESLDTAITEAVTKRRNQRSKSP